MRILFLMAQAYFPHQAGGMQVVTRDLARAFRARGHEAAVAASLSLRGAAGLASGLRALPHGLLLARSRHDGTPLFRVRNIARDPELAIRAFRPDCAIVQSMDAIGMAHRVAGLGIPLIVCFHDAELHRLGGDPAGLEARFVANSAFTASVYAREFGIHATVIPPPVRAEAYRVKLGGQGRGGRAVLINPVAEKGLEIALELAARCPDLPFELVQSWILPAAARRALRARTGRLPNVRLTARQHDMRPVYARTRVLLAPSQWAEGWGRVASEAQVSGIPVLASRIGGLPEAVGDGGLLLPPDAPVSEWEDALRQAWWDPAHAALAAAASAHAARPGFGFEAAVSRMLEEVEAACVARQADPPRTARETAAAAHR